MMIAQSETIVKTHNPLEIRIEIRIEYRIEFRIEYWIEFRMYGLEPSSFRHFIGLLRPSSFLLNCSSLRFSQG